MRKIGHLDQPEAARVFGDYLLVQGIDNQIEAESGHWTIWVHDEDLLVKAEQMLADFQANPKAEQFRKASAEAARLRKQREEEDQAFQKRFHPRGQLRQGIQGYGPGLLAVGCIAVSLVVFVLMKMHRNEIGWFFITEHLAPGSWLDRLKALNEIRHGQIWRLITPIFLHFGLLHILFNMLWLYDLGSMIEARQGSGFFAIQLLAVAAVSNLAQYLVSGPMFGGMSGVVYGLLGYIWIRGKRDVTCGLYLHPITVNSMLIWFFACLAQIMGPVANTAHAAGLLLGMLWGYLASLRR